MNRLARGISVLIWVLLTTACAGIPALPAKAAEDEPETYPAAKLRDAIVDSIQSGISRGPVHPDTMVAIEDPVVLDRAVQEEDVALYQLIFKSKFRAAQFRAKSLKFVDCVFEDGIDLRELQTRGNVEFVSCRVKGSEGVDLRQATIGGSVRFTSLINDGLLRMTSIRVDGSIAIGARVEDDRLRTQVDLSSLSKSGPIIMDHGHVEGDVQIFGVTIRKTLKHHQVLIDANAAEIDEECGFTLDDVTCGGQVAMLFVNVQGNLSWNHLKADGLRISGIQQLSAREQVDDSEGSLFPKAESAVEQLGIFGIRSRIANDLQIDDFVSDGSLSIAETEAGGDVRIGSSTSTDVRKMRKTLQESKESHRIQIGASSGGVRDTIAGNIGVIGCRIRGRLSVSDIDIGQRVNISGTQASNIMVQGVRARRGANLQGIRCGTALLISDCALSDQFTPNAETTLALDGITCDGTAVVSGVEVFGDVSGYQINADSLKFVGASELGVVNANRSALSARRLNLIATKCRFLMIEDVNAEEVTLTRSRVDTCMVRMLLQVPRFIADAAVLDDFQLSGVFEGYLSLNESTMTRRCSLVFAASAGPGPAKQSRIELRGSQVRSGLDIVLPRGGEFVVDVSGSTIARTCRINGSGDSPVGSQTASGLSLVAEEAVLDSDLLLTALDCHTVNLSRARVAGRVDARGVHGEHFQGVVTTVLGAIDLSDSIFKRVEIVGGRCGVLRLPDCNGPQHVVLTRSMLDQVEWPEKLDSASTVNLAGTQFTHVGRRGDGRDPMRFALILEGVERSERLKDQYRQMEQSLRAGGLMREADRVYMAGRERWVTGVVDRAFHRFLMFFDYGTNLVRMLGVMMAMFFLLFLLLLAPYGAEKAGDASDGGESLKDKTWTNWEAGFLAIQYVVPPVSLIGRDWKASDRPVWRIFSADSGWRGASSIKDAARPQMPRTRRWALTVDSIAKLFTVCSWLLWPLIVAAALGLSPSGLYR